MATATPTTTPTTPGERLRQARRTRDLTQQDVASAAGVSRAAIAQWELGVVPLAQVRGDALLKAAKALGVSPDWLVHGRALPEPRDSDYESLPVYPSCRWGEARHQVQFRRDRLKAMGALGHELAFLEIEAETLAGEVVLRRGDLVLVDGSQRSPRHGQVFALSVGDCARVALLTQSFNGTWSANGEPVPDLAEAHLLGRCVWRGGLI
jgi:transcriptional regulator with XRE-family HTH domain